MFFTKIPESHIVTVVKGKDLQRIIPNVGGYRMSNEVDLNGRHWLVPRGPDETDKTGQSLLERYFGITLISWLWPAVHIKQAHISMNKIRPRVDGSPEASVQDMIQVGEGDIDALRFVIPRPVLVARVEMPGDNSQVSFVILATVQTVIPAIPIFHFNGKFMPLLDARLVAGMIDFFSTEQVPVNDDGKFDPKGKKRSPVTFALLLNMSKHKDSPLHRHLLGLNASPEFRTKLEEAGKIELVKALDHWIGIPSRPIRGKAKEDTSLGFLPQYGFVLTSVEVIELEPDETTRELSNALRAKELETRRAEAVVAKATGAADAVRITANGDADALRAIAAAQARRYSDLLEAQTAQGIDPETAARVLETEQRTGNIRDSNVTTYVEGGGNSSVMVPANPPPTKP